MIVAQSPATARVKRVIGRKVVTTLSAPPPVVTCPPGRGPAQAARSRSRLDAAARASQEGTGFISTEWQSNAKDGNDGTEQSPHTNWHENHSQLNEQMDGLQVAGSGARRFLPSRRAAEPAHGRRSGFRGTNGLGREIPNALGILRNGAIAAEKSTSRCVEHCRTKPTVTLQPSLIDGVLGATVIVSISHHQEWILAAEIVQQWMKQLPITITKMPRTNQLYC